MKVELKTAVGDQGPQVSITATETHYNVASLDRAIATLRTARNWLAKQPEKKK